MAVYMKTVTESEPALGAEERNLLSVAYKNVVSALRSAWRIVSTIEQRAHDIDNAGVAYKTSHDYRIEIEHELGGVCNELLVGL